MCFRSEEGSVRHSTFHYRVDPTNTSGVVFLVGHDNDGDDNDNDDNDDDIEKRVGERRLPWARRAFVSPLTQPPTLNDDHPQQDVDDDHLLQDVDVDHPLQDVDDDHPEHDDLDHHNDVDVDDHDHDHDLGQPPNTQ